MRSCVTLRKPDALVGLVDDEPLAFEDPQGLANRHAADAEALGEFRFDDTITWQNAAGGCCCDDLIDDRVNQGTRPQRLPSLLRDGLRIEDVSFLQARFGGHHQLLKFSCTEMLKAPSQSGG